MVSLGVRTRAFLEDVDIATATPVSINRRAAEEWVAGVEFVLDGLVHYLEDAAYDVLLLCERMAARLDVADVDDSDGGLGEVLRSLEALHAEACARCPFPAHELSDRLERLAYASDMEVFADWRVTHAQALGA